MALEAWMRALHLLFGLAWAGAGIYRGIVVERLLKRGDDVAAPFFARAVHGPFMAAAATGTVLFGSITLIMGSQGTTSAYDMAALGDGFFLFHGALGLAMLGFVLGLAGHLPTDIRLRPIARARAAGEPHDEEAYHRLARREALLGRISGVLIMGAVVGMVTFRAVGA